MLPEWGQETRNEQMLLLLMRGEAVDLENYNADPGQALKTNYKSNDF